MNSASDASGSGSALAIILDKLTDNAATWRSSFLKIIPDVVTDAYPGRSADRHFYIRLYGPRQSRWLENDDQCARFLRDRHKPKMKQANRLGTRYSPKCLPVAMRALVARDFRGVRSSARPDDEAAKVAEGWSLAHTRGGVAIRRSRPHRKTVREFSEAANIPEETVWRKLRGRLIPDKEPQWIRQSNMSG
jgi:hypothetical protein